MRRSRVRAPGAYLVGFNLSALLWRKVRGDRLAGRVQLVALRLLYERGAEIEAFEPEAYWVVEAAVVAERGGGSAALKASVFAQFARTSRKFFLIFPQLGDAQFPAAPYGPDLRWRAGTERGCVVRESGTLHGHAGEFRQNKSKGLVIVSRSANDAQHADAFAFVR